MVDRLKKGLAPLFQRFYVCLEGCETTFVQTCRPLIGLDACFLKGVFGGQLLVAIAKDGINQMLLIAFVVMDIQAKETWQQFVDKLTKDIGPTYEYNGIS